MGNGVLRTWRWRLRATLVALIAAVVTTSPGAASQPSSALEPQALSTVIDALSRRFGRPIVASPDLLRGRTARVPQDAGGLEAALSAVLAPLDLRFEVLETGGVIVRAATRQPTPSRRVQPEAAEPDTVIVRGRYSGSLASARQIRRRSVNLVDAVDAQDIGDYPARNVAESLLRTPGVSIVRERGEGLFVSVRGLAPNFQLVTLDGRALSVNENVRDSGQDGRQFRFDVLAPETIASVSVIKTPKADQEEGAIGAIIDIKTYDPLDMPDETYRLSAAVDYSDLTDRFSPRLAALASWRDDSLSRGVFLAGSYMERDGRQDRVTGVGYEEIEYDQQRLLAMTAARPTLERESRRRLTLNGKLEWRGETQGIQLAAFHSRLDSDYDELTYSADLTKPHDVFALTAQGGTVISLEGRGASQIGHERSSLRHDNSMVTVDVEQDLGQWTFRGALSATRAVSATVDPILRTRLRGDVGRIRLAQPNVDRALPDVSLLEVNLEQPRALPFRRIEWRRQRSEDYELSGALDAQRTLSEGPFAYLSAGVSWRGRTRVYERKDVILTDLGGERFGDEMFNPFPVSGFLGASGILDNWLQPDADAFLGISDRTSLFEGPTAGDLRNSYKIQEEIVAGYVMADAEVFVHDRPLRANLGLRLALSEQRSSGYAAEADVAAPVAVTRHYVDALPSLNAVYEASERIWLRASAARVITRPSLADLAPRLTLNSAETVLEARGGNPGLGRYQGWQYDVSAEYEEQTGLISLGFFYKDIDQFIFDQVSTLDLGGVLYELTGPSNGGRAHVYGAELAGQLMFSRLPAPLDRTGVHANYTLTRSRAHYSEALTDELPDVAPASYHVTAFYEGRSLQARLAYSWRDALIASVGPDAALISNRDAFGSLEASLSWRPVETFEIQLQGANLMNVRQTEHVGDGLFAGYTEFGRSISLLARYNF